MNGTEYTGASALEIVEAMRRNTTKRDNAWTSPRAFLRWAHAELHDKIPARELDVSDRLSAETLALNYLCLCDEYGVGELSDAPQCVHTKTA